MATPIANMTATWANSSITYTGIGMDVNTHAYHANSKILNFKSKGNSIFGIGPIGDIYWNESVLIPSGTNLNTVIKNGHYRFADTHTNTPGSGTIDYGQMIVSRGIDTIWQLATGFNNNKMWFRHGNPSEVGGGGSWQSWKELQNVGDNLFLGNGGIINFNSGDVTLTHSLNLLTLGGGNLDVVFEDAAISARMLTSASSCSVDAQVHDFWSATTYSGTRLVQYGATRAGTTAGISNANLGQLLFQNCNNALIGTNGPTTIGFYTSSIERMRINTSGQVTPATNDGTALGSTSLMWSDLFLASGGVINWNNGDVLLAHSSDYLYLQGGRLRIEQNIGNSHATNLIVAALGTAQNQQPGISFYPTFIGTGDNGPRRAADIFAGFTGAWGTQYLAFCVGSATNDLGDLTPERMRISADGDVSIGTTDSPYRLTVRGDSFDGGWIGASGAWSWFGLGGVNNASDGAGGLQYNRATGELFLWSNNRDTRVNRAVINSTNFSPVTNDSLALGTGSLMWSDLWLASGGTINWNNNDVYISHSANQINVAGASSWFFQGQKHEVQNNGGICQYVCYRTDNHGAADVAYWNIYGKDSGNNFEEWGRITINVIDATAGSEDSQVGIGSMTAGTFYNQLFVGAGIQIGVPTGGFKGLNTLNCAGDIYKNNSAYTNPDYVLEHYYTGKIEKFAHHEGANTYPGLMLLSDLESYLQEHHHLPRVPRDDGAGIFERSDFVLEKLEELFLYVIALEKRISQLEGR